MINRRLALAAAVMALAFGAPALAAKDSTIYNPKIPPIPDYIAKAVADTSRAEKQRIRDPNRKPAETLALVGLKPGDRVIELASFGQYYTDIMAPIVGPKGKIYMYDLPYTDARQGAATRTFVAAHPNTEFKLAKYDEIDYPKNVDLITIVLYYHDLKPNKVDTAVLDAKLFEALKPGGKLLIVDHKAQPGTAWRDAGTIHRMAVETIVEEVTHAGFKLKYDSNLLANPGDDHLKMVFAPDERGHTDQAVFVFEKPAKR
jgi:predicted methyltransferase